MVDHQNKGMNSPFWTFGVFFQPIKIKEVVFIGKETGLAVISALDDVSPIFLILLSCVCQLMRKRSGTSTGSCIESVKVPERSLPTLTAVVAYLHYLGQPNFRAMRKLGVRFNC
ncbi:hypothetical protein VT98_11762 [Candidatus Electrothrix communis]|uniref:Uncharacterized protein n=1 Tax=Candidatus Electrothrix communis TaxID=1859133 RepID=A0A3S3UE96_9BACT|nr:hypothetical protein VT98_11762 [Candidatus Electrothrix communis]